MKKNKLLIIMSIILVVITLVGAAALTFVLKMSDKDKEPSIEEVLEASVDVPEITTNLASDDFIRISFKIQTNSKKAKEELEKRDFQVKNLIIQELSEKEAKDLQGKEGKFELENTLKKNINGLMKEGHVVKVYITQSLLQ